jgi:cytochrome c oxidase subunit 4
MVLTSSRWARATLDLGAINLVIAVGIATIKATIVALMFMHLKWGPQVPRHHLQLLGHLPRIFIAFTMFDTEARGQADHVQSDRPVNVKAPFKGTAINGKQEAARLKAHGLPADQPLQPATLAPPN